MQTWNIINEQWYIHDRIREFSEFFILTFPQKSDLLSLTCIYKSSSKPECINNKEYNSFATVKNMNKWKCMKHNTCIYLHIWNH